MKTAILAEKLNKETAKIFVGKEDKIELIIMSIFTGGHVLIDDLPGSGKTTLIKTISRALGCKFGRVQFTPDLLPSDIIGMTVFEQHTGEFRHIMGPVFTNILLADEINRAIPRTQSALLEAMEEQQVTIDNDTFSLPEPFFVMATQNPVERESTFRLPAAQMDRFFVCLSLGFPDREEEAKMLTTLGDRVDFSVVDVVSNPKELMEIRSEIESVFVSDYVKSYIVDLVQRTREHKMLLAGGSPRASRCLYQGGKSYAAMQGRDYVTPEDIAEIFLPILGHRVNLSNEARYTKKTAADILTEILEETPVPPERREMFNEKTAGE
ncbi:MAG: MoxR family ATPase [Oscillospiraceae bacterium]|nr:MoxR family ATPase [Oscillospiraceae bacterium]